MTASVLLLGGLCLAILGGICFALSPPARGKCPAHGIPDPAKEDGAEEVLEG